MEKMNRNKIPYPGKLQAPEYGLIRLDVKSRGMDVVGSGKKVPLTAMEYQILWLLTRAQGALVANATFAEFVYDDRPEEKDIPLSNSVEVTLHRVRAKLELATDGAMTVGNRRGLGYLLEIKQ